MATGFWTLPIPPPPSFTTVVLPMVVATSKTIKSGEWAGLSNITTRTYATRAPGGHTRRGRRPCIVAATAAREGVTGGRVFGGVPDRSDGVWGPNVACARA